ncbi:MAG TPA: hypothetical protein VKY62_14715 [Devosia sp.]|nr:hypothetical protein [Devosia sp.]
MFKQTLPDHFHRSVASETEEVTAERVDSDGPRQDLVGHWSDAAVAPN